MSIPTYNKQNTLIKYNPAYSSVAHAKKAILLQYKDVAMVGELFSSSFASLLVAKQTLYASTASYTVAWVCYSATDRLPLRINAVKIKTNKNEQKHRPNNIYIVQI